MLGRVSTSDAAARRSLIPAPGFHQLDRWHRVGGSVYAQLRRGSRLPILKSSQSPATSGTSRCSPPPVAAFPRHRPARRAPRSTGCASTTCSCMRPGPRRGPGRHRRDHRDGRATIPLLISAALHGQHHHRLLRRFTRATSLASSTRPPASRPTSEERSNSVRGPVARLPRWRSAPARHRQLTTLIAVAVVTYLRLHHGRRSSRSTPPHITPRAAPCVEDRGGSSSSCASPSCGASSRAPRGRLPVRCRSGAVRHLCVLQHLDLGTTAYHAILSASALGGLLRR